MIQTLWKDWVSGTEKERQVIFGACSLVNLSVVEEENRVNRLSSVSASRTPATFQHTYSRVEVRHVSPNNQMASAM